MLLLLTLIINYSVPAVELHQSDHLVHNGLKWQSKLK